MRYLKATDDPTKTVTAEFFLTGKNFHPTHTHVIVGGIEAHSISPNDKTPAVEVVNRQLLRVRIASPIGAHSGDDGFEVRVGTPGGMSNGILITSKPVEKAATSKQAFDWDKTVPSFEGAICGVCGTKVRLDLVVPNPQPCYKIAKTKQTPFDVCIECSTLYVRWSALGTTGEAKVVQHTTDSTGAVGCVRWEDLASSLQQFVNDKLSTLSEASRYGSAWRASFPFARPDCAVSPGRPDDSNLPFGIDQATF